jgi:DNA-directed RNA polymerase subunit RPC12/RpoP
VALTCPKCGQTLPMTDEMTSSRLKVMCPDCGEKFVVKARTEPSREETGPEPGPALKPAIGPKPVPASASASVSAPSYSSRLMGGCRLGRRLGLSGGGVEFKGVALATGEAVVVTVLRPDQARDASFVARLTRSFHAASLVRHPNLARVLEVIDDGEAVAMARQRVGTRLSEARPAMSADAVAAQVARAIQAARTQEISYAMPGPEWVEVDERGRVAFTGLGWVEPDQEGALPAEGATVTALGALGDVLGATPALRELADPDGRARTIDAALARLMKGLPTSDACWTGERIGRLERLSRRFDEAPTRPLRDRVRWLSYGVTVGLIGLLLLIGWYGLAIGLMLLLVLTAAADLALRGPRPSSLLATGLRAFAVDGRPRDWLRRGLGVMVAVVFLWVVGLLAPILVLGLAGVLLVVVATRSLDGPLAEERRQAVADGIDLLREMRGEGIDEGDLRHRVWLHAGERPDEWFAALFGPEAALEARRSRASRVGGRFEAIAAGWADPVVTWCASRVDGRKDERARDLIRSTTERGLCARGMNLLTARRRADRVAEAVIATSSRMRSDARLAGSRPIGLAMREAAERPDETLLDLAPPGHQMGAQVERLLDVVMGPTVRFWAGVVLLAGFGMWAHQNGLIPGQKLRELASRAAEVRDLNAARELGATAAATATEVDLSRATEPLSLSFLPFWLTRLCDGLAPALAGLVLVLSSAVSVGWGPSLWAVPAAAIALLGPRLGVSGIGPFDPGRASLVLAGAVALGGWWVSMRRGRP